MTSLILRTTAPLLEVLLVLFSLFLLLRGHNEPGGGFSGGLLAAAAFSLRALAHGVESARRTLRFHPIGIMASGLSIALLSGCLGWWRRGAFLSGNWMLLDIGNQRAIKLGTPFLFDIGVYLIVLGFAVMVIFTLMESSKEL